VYPPDFFSLIFELVLSIRTQNINHAKIDRIDKMTKCQISELKGIELLLLCCVINSCFFSTQCQMYVLKSWFWRSYCYSWLKL